MAKRRKQSNVGKLDVVWTVTDKMWAIIEPILLADAPPQKTGRPRTNLRRAGRDHLPDAYRLPVEYAAGRVRR